MCRAKQKMRVSTVPTSVLALSEDDWQRRQSEHRERIDRWIAPHLARARQQQAHPVYDFLFSYYAYRPAQLRRWGPGIGVELCGPAAESFLANSGYHRTASGAEVDPTRVTAKRREFIHWLIHLLNETAGRAGFFGCSGLHEWAMVYHADAVRHSAWPLRMSMEHLADVVESLPIRCSHYDAFRFFTPDAERLNRLQPTRESAPDHEQPACLHANMDLYKWAFKLAPLTPAELIADAFELAVAIREVDMRASPYDFSALGFDPIQIETAEGRTEYETAQRAFARQAAPIRNQLASACRNILSITETIT